MTAPEFPSLNDRVTEQFARTAGVLEELLRRGLVVDEIAIGQPYATIKIHFTQACLTVPEAVWWRIESTPAGRKTDWVWVIDGVRVVWTSIAPPVVH